MSSLRSAAFGVATLAVMFASAAPAAAVPITFAGTGNAYELVFAEGISWNAAEAAALGSFYAGSQGHLVTVTSAAENAFITTSILQNGEWWLGGSQAPGSLEPDGGWNWVNGEGAIPGTASLFPYANWWPGEPNDDNGGEMYLMIYGPGSDSGLWNDAGILNAAGYVVEYDNVLDANPVPEPTTLILVGGGVLAVAVGRARRGKTHVR